MWNEKLHFVGNTWEVSMILCILSGIMTVCIRFGGCNKQISVYTAFLFIPHDSHKIFPHFQNMLQDTNLSLGWVCLRIAGKMTSLIWSQVCQWCRMGQHPPQREDGIQISSCMNSTQFLRYCEHAPLAGLADGVGRCQALRRGCHGI